MADISKIILDNTQYNIKDTIARDDIDTLESSMAELNSDFSDLSDEVSEYSSDVEALDTLVQANTQDISTLQGDKVSKSGDTMTGQLRINATLVIKEGALYMNDGTNEHTVLSSSTSDILVNYGGRTLKHLGLYSVDGVTAPIAGFNLSSSYQVVTATTSFVLNANATDTTIDTSISVPSGYTAVGVVGHFFSALPLSARCCGVYRLNQSTVRTALVHTSTSPVPGPQTLTIYVLCLKTS